MTMGLFSRYSLLIVATKMREEDKRKHMIWSFWLTCAATFLVMHIGYAFAAVMMLGLCKEIWDARYGSGFCLFDMLANVIGSLLALPPAIIFLGYFSQAT